MAQNVLLGRQSFENNSKAVELSGGQAGIPVGALSEGQQLLELIDTGDFAPNGSPIREFIQPSVTHDPVSGEDNLPFMRTGRVFDSGAGLGWTLKWFNSRVTQDVIDAAVIETEELAEAQLAQFGVIVDLEYIAFTTAAQHIGPKVSTDFDINTGILNVNNSTFVPFAGGTLNGITNDAVDAFGVGDDTLLEEFDGQSGGIPNGDQAMFLIDGDGTFILEFDPVDASEMGSLNLSFYLAAGGNSNTSYGDFDKVEVRVNGTPVLGPLEGSSDLSESTDPVDPLDVFADGSYQFFDLDISQFAGESEVVVEILADNNNGDLGNNFDAFSIDDVRITGSIGQAPLVGDFNDDGVVDSADYTVWRDTANTAVEAGTGADANNNGFIDSGDYNLWAENYGAAASAGVSVPEPGGMAALLATLGVASFKQRR